MHRVVGLAALSRGHRFINNLVKRVAFGLRRFRNYTGSAHSSTLADPTTTPC